MDPDNEAPSLGGLEIDLRLLSELVARFGGLQQVINKKKVGWQSEELRNGSY